MHDLSNLRSVATDRAIRHRRAALAGLAALGGVALLPRGFAADAAHVHGHDEHQAHRAAAAAANTSGAARSTRTYALPGVVVVDQFGRRVAFDQAMNDGRAVILNFIFTTCTTVCPVMTQIFTQVQDRLGADLARVHMVSVSIDPEHDTPARLATYAQQRGARAQWDFYTGTSEASVAVQRAFDAYRGDKMNHVPVTLVRGARGASWVRLDGFASAETIVDAYRSLAG